VQLVVTLGPWPNSTLDGAVMETIYDGSLLGSAHLEEAPFPSPADALWLSFYPLAYVAIALLARVRMPRLGIRLWLDGVIAALTVAAVSAAVVFKAVRASTGGDTAAIVTNLAYPVADMLLFGLVVGIMAAGRRRLDRTWIVLGAGLGVFAVCDSIYLYQVAKETYETGKLLDIGWIAGAFIVCLAAWQPARRETAPVDDVPSIAVPVVLSLGSLALLVQDHGSSTETLAVVLAAASMLAVIGRLAVTHHQSRENLTVSRRQARTDSLTGLGNRLKLLRDLEILRADDEAVPHLLLLFDLDGFKHYNAATATRQATCCCAGSASSSRLPWQATRTPTGWAATSSACWRRGTPSAPQQS
jgi:hypothetical protein